ncbi:hypothetical protein [Solwaraspora sp. WMMD406]|uniref:SCO6745 family protein n=1 Tax=Solwaraspora sp. WMMD406 TaxID=3016095 RepID=UPI003241E779
MAYSECPAALARCRRLGLGGWAYQVAGRGGVLGEVSAQTAAAALGFLAVDAVADGWEAARAASTPAEVAAMSLAECCRWGVERLGDYPDVARLTELADQVVDSADATGLPLFAAWRATPCPDDSAGARAAAVVRLLVEHRVGVHLLAVRVAGLTPLEAILTGPDGPDGAIAAGWAPPWPPTGSLIRRRVWAEQMTNRLAGQAFTVLTAAQRKELVTLLDGAADHVR